jgi:glycosyltransferase involved in cell wall biosynthesis
MAADRGLSNIVFGNSPYEEMDRLYSIAYASVATLRKMDVARGMRLSKIFPSLSCGVPVVYAGQGEAAGILRAESCGLTVEPERPDLLSQTLATLADDPKYRSEMGHRGRALVEREYGWSTIVGRWLEEIGVDTASKAGSPIGYGERRLIESRGRYQAVERPALGDCGRPAPPPGKNAEHRVI